MSQFTLLQKRAILSVVAAVGVHVFVVGFWILLIIWDLPLFAIESPEKNPEPEPEVKPEDEYPDEYAIEDDQ